MTTTNVPPAAPPKVAYFTTVALAAADTQLIDAQIIQTAGRTTANDGGEFRGQYHSTGRAGQFATTPEWWGGFAFDGAASDDWIEATNKTVANARTFGALGDNATDDTAALQLAIDAFASEGHGTVFIPEGIYWFDRLILPTAVTIQGAGTDATLLLCKDSTTLDAGVSHGSALRRADDGNTVSRVRIKDLGLVSALSSVAASEVTFQNVIGLNLCGMGRVVLENLNISGFGYGGLVLARAENGTEGLGFTNTAQDGNYSNFTNVYLASCGYNNTSAACIWFKYKANQNTFTNVVGSNMHVAFGLDWGNNNNVLGASVESSESIANFGANAFTNAIYGARAEVLSSHGYIYHDDSALNIVVVATMTGVTGDDHSYSGGSTNNRIYGGGVNYFRSAQFPPATSPSTNHALSIMEVTALAGDSSYPLYVTSLDYDTLASPAVLQLHSTVLAALVDDELAQINAWTSDTNNPGVAAQLKAVATNTTGQVGWVITAGTVGTTRDQLYVHYTGVGVGAKPGTSTPNLATAGARFFEVSSNSAGLDAVLSLTGEVTTVGTDIWFDRSVGQTFIDNRYDHVNGAIRFRTKTKGTPIEAFTILGDGDVGIGVTAPTASLDIDQPSATGAKPVVRLDQGDTDETFIDFIGTSAADGTASISSDTTEDSAKFGAIRIEINGVHKWIRIYDDES